MLTCQESSCPKYLMKPDMSDVRDILARFPDPLGKSGNLSTDIHTMSAWHQKSHGWSNILFNSCTNLQIFCLSRYFAAHDTTSYFVKWGIWYLRPILPLLSPASKAEEAMSACSHSCPGPVGHQYATQVSHLLTKGRWQIQHIFPHPINLATVSNLPSFHSKYEFTFLHSHHHRPKPPKSLSAHSHVHLSLPVATLAQFSRPILARKPLWRQLPPFSGPQSTNHI